MNWPASTTCIRSGCPRPRRRQRVSRTATGRPSLTSSTARSPRGADSRTWNRQSVCVFGDDDHDRRWGFDRLGGDRLSIGSPSRSSPSRRSWRPSVYAHQSEVRLSTGSHRAAVTNRGRGPAVVARPLELPGLPRRQTRRAGVIDEGYLCRSAARPPSTATTPPPIPTYRPLPIEYVGSDLISSETLL